MENVSFLSLHSKRFVNRSLMVGFKIQTLEQAALHPKLKDNCTINCLRSIMPVLDGSDTERIISAMYKEIQR